MDRCDAIAWAVKDGGCDGCGKPLVGRQQRWCSDGCDELYWTNHRWPRARAAALLRPGVRVFKWRWRTRWDWENDRPLERFVEWVFVGWQCSHCFATTRSPEVNHIHPALGAHSQESCAHHQDNLEIICHPCHLVETRRQRASGWARVKRAPQPAPAQLFMTVT